MSDQVNDNDAQHYHRHHRHGHHPHGHGHSHSHGNEEVDHWKGEDYFAKPGVLEVASITHESVIHQLQSAGITEEGYGDWDVLEIGSGPGAVTKYYLRTFSSVHAIDISPSMLTYLSSHLYLDLNKDQREKLTWSLHHLSPSSKDQFSSGKPLRSPTEEDPTRELVPPRREFDMAVSNLVLHHVDDLDGFMLGALSLLNTGGWLVVTEIGNHEHHHGEGKGKEGGIESMNEDGNPIEGGSFNAPNHYRPPFTLQTLTELFEKYNLKDIHAEKRGELPVFGTEEGKPRLPNLTVRGRKA